MEIKNAIIESASITINGYLTVHVTLKYYDCNQRFGGHALYLPKDFNRHNLKSIAGHYIYNVMKIAGVNDWDSLAGRAIRAKGDDFHIYEIGHIVENEWFDLTADREE